MITQGGYATLQKFVDGTGYDLAPWTQTNLLRVKPQSVNRLGLLVDGDRIGLFLNHQLLTTVTDPTAHTGAIGFIGSTGDVGGLEVMFDNFDLWLLPIQPRALSSTK